MNLDLKADRAEFIALLRSTGREGVDDLIEYLDDGRNRFFTAPASVSHHLNKDGGLVRHSLNVCHAALKLREMVIAERPDLEAELNESSVIIASLLHDISKADIYIPTRRKSKHPKNGLTEYIDTYNVNYSNFPMGHGEKSAIMALWSGLDITQEELLAIRWHMTAWDLPFQSNELTRSMNVARDKYPLCSLIQLADGIAASLFEFNTRDNDEEF
ncbi:MAG: TraI domain-containing protein [Muribaculaceae bacterium]|nr:TraI domain-containing protein [Muribaculaceae bacterium]